MIRKRLITVLTLNNGVLFRTRNFLPDYRYTANFVDTWSVDEILVLDVTRPGQGERRHSEGMVRKIAEECFVPLSVGGGVRSVEDFRRLLSCGADKVVVNTGAIDDPGLVERAARAFGTQCVVACIDAARGPAGYEVMADFGQRRTGLAPAQWAARLCQLGAGEIILQSVERDGTLEGYDLELCASVRKAASVPLLICCGAGKWAHFAEGFLVADADGVCTQNIFHFTEASIRSAKNYLHSKSIPVRL
ncbi:MAG: imidazole glycerol phosphate synthase subunit HisF [Humidesulfovibrio sp.]